MGRATRWLKGLLGMKKDRDKERDDVATPISSDKKEKKRWSFSKSGKDDAPATLSGNMKDAAWLSSYLSETEREQNKHAIAVAAATAAAADAAVAAAQAAVAVVRLTSHGRGTMLGGGKEKWAAVKIQTVFRGYLVSGFLNFDFEIDIYLGSNFKFKSWFSDLGVSGLCSSCSVWLDLCIFLCTVMKCF